jgi:uncharacterized membrane protein
MRNKLDKEILNAMSRDPQYWIGPFYFNKKDYRIIVPKYSPWMGWTLNFANPYSYLSLACIIIISIVYGFLLK